MLDCQHGNRLLQGSTKINCRQITGYALNQLLRAEPTLIYARIRSISNLPCLHVHKLSNFLLVYHKKKLSNVNRMPPPVIKPTLIAPLSVAEGVAAEVLAVAVEESLPFAFFSGPL